MLHLRKHFSPLLRAASHLTTDLLPLSSSLRRPALLSASASASGCPTPTPTPFPVEEYLVATCGLTRAQALKATKKLTHFNASSNPDGVLALLSGVGLSRRDVAAVVSADPLLLRSRVGNIAHRLASLRERVGLSDPEVARFLLACGGIVRRTSDVASKLEFWIPFFGSFDKLLRSTRFTYSILTADIERVAKPNIALLKQCGLSVCDIVKLSTRSPRLLALKPERIKAIPQRVDELGAPHTACQFKYLLGFVGSVSEGKAATRMEYLRSTLGCSMKKVRIAVCQKPSLLGLSEENLRRKIEFLVTEVGLDPEYIVERPTLLVYSLEKRMLPRYHVAKILEEKGLLEKGIGFYKLISYREDIFIRRYIDCYKGTIPGLADAYAAARAGDIPAKVSLNGDVEGSS